MKKIILVFIMAILAIIIPVSMTFAQSCSTKEDCQNLINQYTQKLSSIRDQKNTLSSQINIMDTQIILTTVKIQDTQYTIKKTGEEIDSLTGKIDNLNTSLDYLSKVFLKKVSDGYKRREAPLVDIFIDSDTAAKLTNRLKYMQVAQDSDRKIAFKVEQAKANYEDQKKLREVKKAQLDQLTKVLAQQQISLEQQKSQKQQLLVQTGNDEATYQRLLADVQRQIQGYKTFVQSTGAGVIPADSLGTGEGGWYYSQRDSRWANAKMGDSNESVLNVGCFITSIAMVMKFYGANFTPLDIASNAKYFSYGPNSACYPYSTPTAYACFPGTFNGSWPGGKSYHNVGLSEITDYVNRNVPVIAGVRGGNHYVVIKKVNNGEFIMNDPIYGPDKKVSDYYSLSGPFGVFE